MSDQKRIAYVYMVQCADGSLYTGWTYDPQARLQAHNSGRGAKYTRARRPVALVYIETCADQQMARQREYAIKKLGRGAKLALIANPKNPII